MEEDKSINKVLSGDERMVLFEMMLQPGWEVFKKITSVMSDDWIQQTANLDMSAKTDEEMIRILRQRQGQIKGMSLVIEYLEKKRRDTLKAKK